MNTLTSTSTLDEFNAALQAGEVTLKQAKALLTPRIERGSKSGVRAQAWLNTHKHLAPVQAQAKKALKAAKGPKPTKYGRLADGRPVSDVAWALRGELYKAGVERTYAECIAAVQALPGVVA